MARGGKRQGAGRKCGSLSQRTREIAEAVLVDGSTPLEFMLARMNDTEADMRLRADMAKAAAQYMHPRLNSIEHSGEGGGPIGIVITSDDAKF